MGLQKINKFFTANRAASVFIHSAKKSPILPPQPSPQILKQKTKNLPIKRANSQIRQTFQQPLCPYYKPNNIVQIVQDVQSSILPHNEALPIHCGPVNQNLLPMKIDTSQTKCITLPNTKNKRRSSSITPFIFPKGDAGLPNLIVPNLDILFVGINPGRHSCQEKHHFAGPVNHFWKCLHESKLTERLCCSKDDIQLATGTCNGKNTQKYRIGITNMVKRATKLASDIEKEEWKEGAINLLSDIKKALPKFVVFNGISTFRNFIKYAIEVNDDGKQTDQPVCKSNITNMKILPGLQDDQVSLKLQNVFSNSVKFFAIPSSSPLARVAMSEKLFYYKEIKNLVDRERKPCVFVEKGEVESQEMRNQKVYEEWLSFYSSYSY